MNVDEFSRALAKQANDTMTLTEAQNILKNTHGRGASQWLANHAGIAQRTAQRWLSPAAPPARRSLILTAASAAQPSDAARAATILRGRKSEEQKITVDVGSKVKVSYDAATPQGVRPIGERDIRIDDVTAALDDDDFDAASQHFHRAVLDAYGIEDQIYITDIPHIQLGN